MNILLLGATGTFGKSFTKKLLSDTNYNLTLVSRKARDMYKDSDRQNVINADITNIEELKRVIKNQDIVYCAISGEQLPIVAENLVNCISDNQRLIFMGAVGIYNEIPDELDGKDNVDNNTDQLPNRDAVNIIEKSDVRYTILRPGYLRDGLEDDYVITKKGELTKGYITTIQSVEKIVLEIMKNNNLYLKESISITKDMK